ncbi:biopolymer transporter ExbD [Flavobacterium akiainvivens]|uniref:Biopolymer transporter ExbD n=1 Tax=Flavobacterium akiainvivens TaxID=1202724 RepID=A0A0M8MK81_9FLAO|nr:biopolymer transporter ExbD [Flavobacterium akiainvivens]KOS07537.1 biopolymer transporter ExbD [Flavobacterium akiainvivens]SFQ64175.1 outer membrane transport energization protein ExbD [Flavobacterium akiainvivens]
MAELNTGDGGGGKGKKVRSKKSNPGVDLTAMVDLAFLLITFFMLTTSLAKKQAMELAMPDKDKKDPQPDSTTKIPEERMMTILIGKDNRILWYMGKFDAPTIPPTEAKFGKDGIRQDLLKNVALGKEYAKREGKPEQGLVVNIKASDAATFKNVVDILDEMAITHPQLYAIGDITLGEIDLLKQTGVY